MMYVAFTDVKGATGMIAADWTIEYDGEFTDTTDAVVSNMDQNGNASSGDLQGLMLTLYQEGYLEKIKLVDDTQRQEPLRWRSRVDRRLSGDNLTEES